MAARLGHTGGSGQKIPTPAIAPVAAVAAVAAAGAAAGASAGLTSAGFGKGLVGRPWGLVDALNPPAL